MKTRSLFIAAPLMFALVACQSDTQQSSPNESAESEEKAKPKFSTYHNPDCSAQGDVNYICGPHNAEDLMHIPDTNWVITSGRHLQYFNIETKQSGILAISYPEGDKPEDLNGCPSVVRREDAINHGINARLHTDKPHELLLISHGPRESVELFDIIHDDNETAPSLAWKGCVEVPHPAFGNSVAPLGDEGLLVAVTIEVTDPDFLIKLKEGRPTGYVLEWLPEQGWRRLLGSEFSGNNGIEVSRDGEWVFVGNYGSGSVAKFKRIASTKEEAQVKEIKLPSPIDQTDNLRWSTNGMLMATGHKGPQHESHACDADVNNICHKDYGFSEIDPESFEVIRSVSRPGIPSVYGSATTTLRVGDNYYLGTHRGKRVAIIPVDAQ